MSNSSQNKLPSYPSLERARITDGFFADLIQKIHKVSAKDILKKFLADGILENYERVANGLTGGCHAYPWFHGLICECIRGISDLLVIEYDREADETMDRIIEPMGRAQARFEDGFINPYTTLTCPSERWGRNGGDLIWLHETYNTGCLAEAGVHHYLATGKISLLLIAVKACNGCADFIGDAPRHNVVPEHSLPEKAFLKLYQLFNERPALASACNARPSEYLRLAEYFIDHKGDNETRYSEPKFMREYSQDHRPATEQREAVGHAVRSMLFAEGVAAIANEKDREDLRKTARAIWQDVTEHKLHINGCVGIHRHEEKFGHPYHLPNNAYLETCAGVGLIFFGIEMFRMTENASIWDTIESTLYNVIPASVAEDGVKYTYENPLESDGSFERWIWHKCPCCPPMLLKLVGMLPTLVFAEREHRIWLNLLTDSQLVREDATLTFSKGKLTVKTEQASVALSLRIRIPLWARGFRISLNGAPCSYAEEKGYARIDRDFLNGDTVELFYDTPIVKYEAHPFVKADHGRVAIKHGPVLYCAEEIDNPFLGNKDTTHTLSEHVPLTRTEDGVIHGELIDGTGVTLIPYSQWNNRGKGHMRVWLRQDGAVVDREHLNDWEHLLYRPYREYPG